MVASVMPPGTVRGPVALRNPAARALTKYGNHDSFLAKLRSSNALVRGPAADHSEVRHGDDERGTAVAQMFRSPHPEDDLSPALAPEDQSVLALGRGLEPGEWLALFQPGAELSPAVPPGPQSPGVTDVSALVERWVRRVALGGDARRGVAKLDIGAGRYAGAELVIVAEAGQVAVELALGEAADPSLAERLRRRLQGRGYVAEVVVR